MAFLDRKWWIVCLFLWSVVGCDRGTLVAEPPDNEPDCQVPEAAVIDITSGTLLRSFPVQWEQNTIGQAAQRRLLMVDARYVSIGGRSLTSTLYDVETGQQVNALTVTPTLSRQNLAPDAFAPRLLTTEAEQGTYTFPGGGAISDAQPLSTILQAIHLDGTVAVLHRETLDERTERRAAFPSFRNVVPLADGDVLYIRAQHEYLVTRDSLGTAHYVTPYDETWALYRYDAQTGSPNHLLTFPGEAYNLASDPLGEVVSFDLNGQGHLYEAAADTMYQVPYDGRAFRISENGYFLLGRASHTPVVFNRLTQQGWLLQADGQAPFRPHVELVVLGANNWLYASTNEATQQGVWRMRTTDREGLAKAVKIWSAARFMEQRGWKAEGATISQPALLNDETLIVVIKHDAYPVLC